MKRFVSLLSVLLILSTIFIGVTPRQAGARWVQEEVGWQISSVGTPYNATAIYVRDTCCNALGGGASNIGDTTSTFSLDNAAPLPRGLQGYTSTGAAIPVLYNGLAATAPNDTTVVGWVVIQGDSSTAAGSVSGINVMLDGRAGPYGSATTLSRGWVRIDSTLVTTAATNTGVTQARGADETFTIPIRSQGLYHTPFSFRNLRAIITAIGAGGVAQCRVFIRYWTNDPVDGGQRR